MDVATGGGVSAVQGGPDAVVRYANTQIALTGLGMVGGDLAGDLLSKIDYSKAGRAAKDLAWKAKYEAKMLKPVTTGKLVGQQRQYMQRIIAAENRAMEAEAQMQLAEKLADKKNIDMDYVKLFKQSLIEDDARRLAMEAGPESTPFTRSGQNRARIEAAKNPFLKPSEDIERDIRLTNRFLREKGKWVAMRSRALMNDPEYRKQINDALARQLAKSKGMRAVNEAMSNIVEEEVKKFKFK